MTVGGTVCTMQSCNLFILSTCDLEFFEYFSPLVEKVILSPTSVLHSFLWTLGKDFISVFCNFFLLLNNPGTLLDALLTFCVLYDWKNLICLYSLKILFHSSFQPFLAKFYSFSFTPALPCPPLVSNTRFITFSYVVIHFYFCVLSPSDLPHWIAFILLNLLNHKILHFLLSQGQVTTLTERK